jgi:hypothetical protein
VAPDYERRGHEYRAYAETLRKALLSWTGGAEKEAITRREHHGLRDKVMLAPSGTPER